MITHNKSRKSCLTLRLSRVFIAVCFFYWLCSYLHSLIDRDPWQPIPRPIFHTGLTLRGKQHDLSPAVIDFVGSRLQLWYSQGLPYKGLLWKNSPRLAHGLFKTSIHDWTKITFYNKKEDEYALDDCRDPSRPTAAWIHQRLCDWTDSFISYLLLRF